MRSGHRRPQRCEILSECGRSRTNDQLYSNCLFALVGSYVPCNRVAATDSEAPSYLVPPCFESAEGCLLVRTRAVKMSTIRLVWGFGMYA